MKIKNILIVGGSGELGLNFINYLGYNYKIFILDKKKIIIKKNSKNVKFIKIDLLKKKKIILPKIDIVYFFVGKLGGPESTKIDKYRLYFKYNCQTLINFLEMVDKNKIKKLVFTSTEHAYGNKDKSRADNMAIEPNPINYYGLTKLFSEKILLRFFNDYKISVDILRFPRVISINSNNFITKIIKKLTKEKKITIENSVQKFNIIYNLDLMSALKQCLSIKKNKFRIFNIFNNDRPISLRSLATIILKNFKNRNKIKIKYLDKKKNKSHNPENLIVGNLYSKNNLKWKPKYNNLKIIKAILNKNEFK